MLSKPYVTAPILGASKLAHVDQAVEALGIKLTEDQIRRLEEPYKPHPVLDSNAPLIRRRSRPGAPVGIIAPVQSRPR